MDTNVKVYCIFCGWQGILGNCSDDIYCPKCGRGVREVKEEPLDKQPE